MGKRNRKPKSVHIDDGLYKTFSEYCKKNDEKVGAVLERYMIMYVTGKHPTSTHTTSKNSPELREAWKVQVCAVMSKMDKGYIFSKGQIRDFGSTIYEPSKRSFDSLIEDLIFEQKVRYYREGTSFVDKKCITEGYIYIGGKY